MLTVLRQRNFTLLWFGGLISTMGNWMLQVGLPLYVYNLTGSTLATSIMFLTGSAPSLLFGPLAGVYVDRWDRRTILLVANLLLALGLLPLLLVRSADWLWLVYLVSFVQSTLAQFVGPAENALLPLLLKGDEHLLAANALNALNNNLGRLIGPPLGGLVAARYELTGIVVFDALTFLVAALLVALIGARTQRELSEAEAVDPRQNGLAAFWREWLEGLRIVRDNRLVAVLFVLAAAAGLGEGVFIALLVPFSRTVLQASSEQVGWIMAAQAVGGLLGSTVIGAIGRRVALGRLLGISAILLGLIDLLIFTYPLVYPGVYPALALFVIAGLPSVAFGTGIFTLMQTIVSDRYRGRVFAAFGTTLALLSIVGTALAGLLGDRVGILPIINIQALMCLVNGGLALALLRGPAIHSAASAEAA